MKKYLGMVMLALLIVGGLNWGLVGAFDYNLVMTLFGQWPMVEKAVYILVGIAAVVKAVGWATGKCNVGMDNGK